MDAARLRPFFHWGLDNGVGGVARADMMLGRRERASMERWMTGSMVAASLLTAMLAAVLFDAGVVQAQSGAPPASQPPSVAAAAPADALVAPVRRIKPPKPRMSVVAPVRGGKALSVGTPPELVKRNAATPAKSARVRAGQGAAAKKRIIVRPAKAAVRKTV